MRTPRAAPLHRKTQPSRPQSRARHSRVRTTAIRPTGAGAGTRYTSVPVLHCRSGRFVRRSCSPFPAGFRPPAGVSRSLPREPGNRPPDRKGCRGRGESPPEPRRPPLFNLDTTRRTLRHPRGPVQSSPRPAVRDAPGAHGPPVAAVARHPSATVPGETVVTVVPPRLGRPSRCPPCGRKNFVVFRRCVPRGSAGMFQGPPRSTQVRRDPRRPERVDDGNPAAARRLIMASTTRRVKWPPGQRRRSGNSAARPSSSPRPASQASRRRSAPA